MHYSLVMFGGNTARNVFTNNLIISYNLDNSINKHNVLHGESMLISGYINKLRKDFKLNIPNEIHRLINQFCGLIYTKKKLTKIHERCGHNGTIIYIKNIPYLFIFGGKSKDFKFYTTYLNDIHLIDLKTLKHVT